MYGIKVITTIFIVCGVFYGIGYFLSNESNIMLWPVYGKLFYLLFVLPTSGKAVVELD